MGKRAPSYVSVMPAVTNVFVQPTPANPAFPNATDAVQHALATAGKHAGITAGIYIEEGTTIFLSIPVPPSVVYMKVEFILVGDGIVSIDSTNNGTAKTWGNTTIDGTEAVASTHSTSALPGDLVTSPLKVRSSAAWTWTAESVSVTLSASPITSNGGQIQGVCFSPVWQPQDV